MDDVTSPVPRWMQVVLPAAGVGLILAVWQVLAAVVKFSILESQGRNCLKREKERISRLRMLLA